jgi:hypothetical protein
MVWKAGIRRVRITQSCGKTRTIVHYLVYDGDWLRFETKDKNLVEAFMRKCECSEEEIKVVRKQLINF